MPAPIDNIYSQGNVILIDKPLGWTSFQVVNKMRWLIKQQFNLKNIKVGHAGTLDPLATGLLIVCTGKETKNIDTYQAQIKEYTGTITLGATTPSFDLETEIDQTFPLDHITTELLQQTLVEFTGDIKQLPPIFSAIKKDGVRLYELARAGKTTTLEPRAVRIDQFDLTRIALPEVDFHITCSKGTYIRSIANDYGAALHSGGYLAALRRTAIGNFKVDGALSMEAFEEGLSIKPQ